jgi:hypothetical protein
MILEELMRPSEKFRFRKQHARRNIRVESAAMTFIPAKIVAVGKEADNRTQLFGK